MGVNPFNGWSWAKYCRCYPEPFHVCAHEGGTCYCDGLVAYGIWDRFYVKDSTGNIGCNNNVFGDPYVGYYKHCRCYARYTYAE